MVWNHDITAAPRGRTIQTTRKVKTSDGIVDRQVDEFRRDDILAVHKSGSVDRSYWIPPRYTQGGNLLDGGRWSGFNVGDEPVAWMPWPTYEPSSTAQPMGINTSDHEFMAVCDSVGSGE